MENNTPNTNAQSAENNTAAQQEKTFTQADVDKMGRFPGYPFGHLIP